MGHTASGRCISPTTQHRVGSRSTNTCSYLRSQATTTDGFGRGFCKVNYVAAQTSTLDDYWLSVIQFTACASHNTQDKWSFWQCNLKETWFSHQELDSPSKCVSGTMLGEVLRAAVLKYHLAHRKGLLLTLLWPCRDWNLSEDSGNRYKMMLFTARKTSSNWPWVEWKSNQKKHRQLHHVNWVDDLTHSGDKVTSGNFPIFLAPKFLCCAYHINAPKLFKPVVSFLGRKKLNNNTNF